MSEVRYRIISLSFSVFRGLGLTKKKYTAGLKLQTHAKPKAIRLIGGQWRGRKLDIIQAEGLRPTPDRVRETLFNWLAPHIHQLRVLDLFAGTGALGFESLSRGAAHATFIEANTLAANQLEANKRALACSHASIHNTAAATYLANRPEKKDRFDLVFIDPPFADNLWQDAITALTDEWLNPQALIYLEMPMALSPLEPLGFKVLKHKKMASIYSYLLEKTH